MAIIDELRTPLYFAAGTADLAVQQAKKVPGLIEQLAAEAPARIEAVRKTDPKVVQEKVTAQAKEAQATVQSKFADVVGGLDTDLKKLGDTAQDFALRGVGVAAEYAVKAREKYEEVAAHGEEAVKAWRGEVAEEIVEIAVVVEPEETKAEDKADGKADTKAEGKAEEPKAPARKTTARKAPAKKAAVAAEKE
ncbi:hypothetical protein [Streptomyces zaomyceticus]|uniref:hypothetical protein n=1 Tax=Streptomyces zaomyceticus TaxID=68286 RepID=UPI00167844AE|nr:hypothetical protein [Streptomyces zaomyceticus]GHG31103.1 hypothetical protein GCM10018791_54850 [Streptomyces zaomyceticus]